MGCEAVAELLRVALVEGWALRKKTSLRNFIPRGDSPLAANAKMAPAAATSTASPKTPFTARREITGWPVEADAAAECRQSARPAEPEAETRAERGAEP